MAKSQKINSCTKSSLLSFNVRISRSKVESRKRTSFFLPGIRYVRNYFTRVITFHSSVEDYKTLIGKVFCQQFFTVDGDANGSLTNIREKHFLRTLLNATHFPSSWNEEVFQILLFY